jgi:beta-aspartyl-peptidase (threonine type)
MRYYWKSEDLTFSSGGTTRRGWDETMRRYREAYPTPKEMGKLTFSELEVRRLGDTAALVLGRWALERDKEPVEGNFTLVMEQIDGQWLVTHDHTSRQAAE